MTENRAWADWGIRLVAVGALGAALWFAALILLSVRSEERCLTRGEEKLFGAFDPHLYVSLIESEPTRAGDGTDSVLHRLTLRYRSDALEIRIRPSYLQAIVLDRDGRRFEPVRIDPPTGAKAGKEPLDFVLAPDETATQDFFFELPDGIDDRGLWVHDPHWIARLIPGSETSFLHEKRIFAIQ